MTEVLESFLLTPSAKFNAEVEILLYVRSFGFHKNEKRILHFLSIYYFLTLVMQHFSVDNQVSFLGGRQKLPRKIAHSTWKPKR